MTVLTPAPSPQTLLSTQPLALLSPALTSSLYVATVLRQVLSNTTLFLFLRAYFISALLLQRASHLSSFLAVQSYYASTQVSKFMVQNGKLVLKELGRSGIKMRNRLAYEVGCFVLGGGNGLILVLFWPGWLVIGGGVVGIWSVCG